MKKEIPIVGKKYHFFDDGKIHYGRHYTATVLRVAPFNEAHDIIVKEFVVMAVKIIKECNLKEVFVGWCNYCGCEFEYEKEDTSDSNYDQREKCEYHCIKCPYCDRILWIASVRNRD